MLFDFSWDTYARPGWNFIVTTFDLRTQEILPREEIFLNHEEAYPNFVAYLVPEMERLGEEYFRQKVWLREDTLEAEYLLKSLVFSPQGATLLLTPWVFDSHYSGSTYIIDIPKATMLEWGANPAMWGE